ncbi:hypothetical protein ACLAC8_005004 [Escherichia coli]
MSDSGLMMGVITGDLYRSSTDYERGVSYIGLMEVMLENIKKNNRLRVADVDFFRGDSFQITSKDPINLLSIAVYIRAYLRSYSEKNDDKGMYDARLAISIDKVKEGANKRGNSSRLTQSFHFFMFEPIFSPVNALNQPI